MKGSKAVFTIRLLRVLLLYLMQSARKIHNREHDFRERYVGVTSPLVLCDQQVPTVQCKLGRYEFFHTKTQAVVATRNFDPRINIRGISFRNCTTGPVILISENQKYSTIPFHTKLLYIRISFYFFFPLFPFLFLSFLRIFLFNQVTGGESA